MGEPREWKVRNRKVAKNVAGKKEEKNVSENTKI